MGFGRLMEMVNGIRCMYGSCSLDCTRAPEVLSNCLKPDIIQAPLRLRSRCTSPLGARRCQHQKTNGWSQVRLCLIEISAVLLLQFAYNMIILQSFLTNPWGWFWRKITWNISEPQTLVFLLPTLTRTWPCTGKVVFHSLISSFSRNCQLPIIVDREAKETMAAFLRERHSLAALPVTWKILSHIWHQLAATLW